VARGRDAAAPPHGGFAQRLVVDETRVLTALEALTDVEAAQVEPAAVVVEQVGGEAGRDLGLVQRCLRRARDVDVVDVLDVRQTAALALALGLGLGLGA